MSELKEEIKETVWSFIRSDLSTKDFEDFVYNNSSLEDIFQSEFYLELIGSNFSDKNVVFDLREKLFEFMKQNYPEKCYCRHLRNIDRVEMGTDFCININTFLVKKKDRGESLWWLSLYQCSSCGKNWLVAQDENYDDLYFMKLNNDQSSEILSENKWPNIFNDYESLKTLVQKPSFFSKY